MNDYIVGELAASRRRQFDIEADRTRLARRIRTDIDVTVATVTESARVSDVGAVRSAWARTSALLARVRLGAA